MAVSVETTEIVHAQYVAARTKSPKKAMIPECALGEHDRLQNGLQADSSGQVQQRSRPACQEQANV